jgi:hypothetical protein
VDKVILDLRDIDKLDVQKVGVPLTGTPSQRRLSDKEKQATKAALEFGKKLRPEVGVFLEPINVADKPPAVTIKAPTTVPVGRTPGSATHLTLGIGIGLAAFAVLGITAGGGLYGSSTGEVGVYTTAGGGWWTNMGWSGGGVMTVISGPPADFKGVSIGVGADVRYYAGSFGGLLLFSPPPIRYLGFAVSFSIGPTAIPVLDFTVQVSHTWAKPLLFIK